MSKVSIFDQLKDQPRMVLDKLYEGLALSDKEKSYSPWASKAVFQSLSAVAKCLVMKLLFVEAPFAPEDFIGWAGSSSSSKACHEAFDELVSLRIITTIDNISHADVKPSGNQTHQLNPYFQNSLRKTLASPVEPWSSHSSRQVLNNVPTHEVLDKFCMDKWNEVLGFLVNLLPPSALPSNILVVFVRRAGLMADAVDTNGRKALLITAKGYEYMLKDYHAQVWDFVMVAMRHAQSQEDALSLLFTLSYCTFGKGYPIDALTKCQQQLIFEFSQVGIVYMPSITSTVFYPSRVAINMIFGAAEAPHAAATVSRSVTAGGPIPSAPQVSSQPAQALQVIVETNNQVTAYLTSEIHLAMLQLFVDIYVRMPNMALGRITKEKVRQAFKMGIKASQIVDFLVLHAHPIVAQKAAIVPENITDELALWEAESQRISDQEAVVVDFAEVCDLSKIEFAELVAALEQSGALLWHSETALMVAVKPEGLQLVREAVSQRSRRY